LSTHDTVDGPADAKVSLMAGNDTKPMVVSRKTANTARLVEVSTTHGLRSFAGVTAIVSYSPCCSIMGLPCAGGQNRYYRTTNR
jgi:hypothetical protein